MEKYFFFKSYCQNYSLGIKPLIRSLDIKFCNFKLPEFGSTNTVTSQLTNMPNMSSQFYFLFFQTAITYAFIWYKITQIFNCFPFVQFVRAFDFAILTSRVWYSCHYTFYLLTKQQLCEGTILFKYVKLSCMFLWRVALYLNSNIWKPEYTIICE